LLSPSQQQLQRLLGAVHRIEAAIGARQLVAGDRVTVRGEVTGTPSGDLFGVPHSGKSFRMMAIDIQTIKDGRIAKTFHMENWLSAVGQLRAK
jgi:predicted ester cyclase